MSWGRKEKETMFMKEMELLNKMPLNLQFFAEGEGDGAGGDDGGGAGDDAPTFDELLAAGHQAEFDRRVQKAVTTAVTNAQEKWRVMTDDKISEAEKLAKMTAQEKKDYLQNKREKELDEREKTLATNELKATAKNTLAEKNLPLELADVLNYTDAESCNKSIAAIETAFQSAVEAAVNERLKGGEPPRKATGGNTVFTKEQVSAMTPEEINKNWDAISASMRTWK